MQNSKQEQRAKCDEYLRDTRAGGVRVQGQPGLLSEILKKKMCILTQHLRGSSADLTGYIVPHGGAEQHSRRAKSSLVARSGKMNRKGAGGKILPSEECY